jgi:hypothetical protein
MRSERGKMKILARDLSGRVFQRLAVGVKAVEGRK